MKKQELRRDAFRENVVKGVQYFNDNTATIIKIFVVIVLLVLGMSYYNHLGKIKQKNAAHLAGRAQNTFINGNLVEAMVKFERVIDDYPNTPGAVQSLVYLLNDAIEQNNSELINKLLNENTGKVYDPIVLSSIYKLKGDINHNNADYASALKFYRKAETIVDGNAIQTKYQLDIASALIAQSDFVEALQTLEEIIDNENLEFNEKNIAEELMAYTKQMMGI